MKTITSLFIGSLLLSSMLLAQDYTDEKRDLTIMRGIFQSVMQEDMPTDFPVKIPPIETLYLANQGMVFTVNMPRSSGNNIVTASSGNFVVNLGEAGNIVIDQAYNQNYAVRAEIEMRRAEATRALMDVQTSVQELQAELRELQRSSIDLQTQTQRVRETEAELEAVMQRMAEQRAEVDMISEEAQARQSELLEQQKSMIVDTMTNTLCDYGSTLRTLDSDQFVTLILKNYSEAGSRVMMFEGRDVSSCNDVDSLIDKATVYDI